MKGSHVRIRELLRKLSVGLLVLLGTSGVGSLASSAQQGASTPPVQTADVTSRGNTTPIVGTPQLQPAIDLARVQGIALQGPTRAVVTDVELDGEVGRLTYKVGLDNGTDLRIDEMSGEVIKTEQEQADNGQNAEKRENEEPAGNGDEQENENVDNNEAGNGNDGEETDNNLQG